MKTLACGINEDKSINNFSVWNRRLSDKEIKLLYDSGYNYHIFFRWNWQLFFLRKRYVYKVFKMFKPIIVTPYIVEGDNEYLELPEDLWKN